MDETAVSKSLAGRTSKSCTGKSLLLYSVLSMEVFFPVMDQEETDTESEIVNGFFH